MLPPGYKNCMLTPNLNEFRRLASTMGVSLHGANNDRIRKIHEVRDDEHEHLHHRGTRKVRTFAFS